MATSCRGPPDAAVRLEPVRLLLRRVPGADRPAPRDPRVAGRDREARPPPRLEARRHEAGGMGAPLRVALPRRGLARAPPLAGAPPRPRLRPLERLGASARAPPHAARDLPRPVPEAPWRPVRRCSRRSAGTRRARRRCPTSLAW